MLQPKQNREGRETPRRPMRRYLFAQMCTHGSMCNSGNRTYLARNRTYLARNRTREGYIVSALLIFSFSQQVSSTSLHRKLRHFRFYPTSRTFFLYDDSAFMFAQRLLLIGNLRSSMGRAPHLRTRASSCMLSPPCSLLVIDPTSTAGVGGPSRASPLWLPALPPRRGCLGFGAPPIRRPRQVGEHCTFQAITCRLRWTCWAVMALRKKSVGQDVVKKNSCF